MAAKFSLARKLGVRLAAAAALLVAFAIGAWMPLVNDHVLHDTHGDVGYAPLTMGLLGHTRYDLYQRHSLTEGMYMFRNSYNNDLSVGMRVMEFAARGSGDQVEYGTGRYWTYAKRYYLRIASLIPADLVAGGVGAFVNLMTLPRSLLDRNSQAWRYDRVAPWRSAYSFVDETSPFASILRAMDRAYAAAVSLSAEIWFAANLAVLFVFLWLIARRFGVRAAIAALLLLATALAVASLKFEQRHVFYILSFAAVAWTAVLWLMVRILWAPVRMLRHRSVAIQPAPTSGGWRSAATSAASIALILCVAAAGVGATLIAARAYQTKVLHALVVEWSARSKTPARFQMSEIAPGQSLIRISSPLPLSIGGERAADASLRTVVEMGVVVVTFDGDTCADRRIMVSAVGDSDIPLPETTYLMRETFSAMLTGGAEYVALLPAFNYHQPRNGKVIYSGIELATQDVPCVKSVSTITEFEPHDVLFDFFVQADPAKLRRDDLFQRVYVPGLGFV